MPYITDVQSHGPVTTITRYRVSRQCWCIVIIIKVIIVAITLGVLGAEGVFSGHLFNSPSSTTTTSAAASTQTNSLPVEGYCDTQSFYFYTNSLCTVENNVTYLYNMGYCSTTMTNYNSLPSVVYIGNMNGQSIVFKQWNDDKCDIALHTSTFNINSNCFEYKLNETKYYSMC
jgi:hypothetical protein